MPHAPGFPHSWGRKSVHLCRTCAAPLVKKPGPGRWPAWCGLDCKHPRRTTVRAPVKPKCTPEQLREQRSNAARFRWAGTTPAERSAVATELALARYGEFKPKMPRAGVKSCANCENPVRNTPRIVYCGARACQLRRNRERMSKYTHIRRAQKAQAPSEAFDSREVFDRDGWLCGICQEPVDPDERFPSPMSVSLDHVVPLSKGGHHTRANTRCTHLGCNVKLGNRAA